MTVIALGTFDGVHRGHQKIIKAAVSYAARHNLEPAAITFDPHPQQLIVPERGLKLLTTIEERKTLLHKYGIKKVYVLKFNRAVQKLSPAEFVRKYLVNKLKAKQVFIGYDFAFGSNRSGQVGILKKMGEKYGFKVAVVSLYKCGIHPVKSKKIREELSLGKFDFGVKLLGHPYPITGKVVKGAGRGRELGFPTVNLLVDQHKLIPSHGIYAGAVEIMGKMHKAAVNIGSRPSFGAGDVLIEAHLINFHNNVYGKTAALFLLSKLREEKHFADIEKLKRQIKKDVAKAKTIVL